MIVVEDKLRDLFTQIPDIQVNENTSTKPFFGWGKKEELNKYVLKTDAEVLYPLIWLLPTKDDYNRAAELVEKRLILIIATRETNIEYYNTTRLEYSFKTVLNPLSEYVIQALENSSITRVIDSTGIEIFKEPNYSDSGENATIDKWDAIRLELDVEFNDNCLKTIKWK